MLPHLSHAYAKALAYNMYNSPHMLLHGSHVAYESLCTHGSRVYGRFHAYVNMPKIFMHIMNIHVHTMCPCICIQGPISYVVIGASWPTISCFDQHKLPAAHVHCQNIPFTNHLLHGHLDIALYLQHNSQQALLKIPTCDNASNVVSLL